MARMHAGGRMRARGGGGSGDRANHSFDLRAREASGAKQNWLRPGQREHGGFDADVAGAAIKEVVHVEAQATADVVGGGGRELREAIRAGSGEGHTRGLDQCEGDGMSGHTQAYGGEASGDDEGDSP